LEGLDLQPDACVMAAHFARGGVDFEISEANTFSL
jgi:hypothetical protein